MAFYTEEQVWKCRKHPPRRRHTTGVCSSCLHERLGSLCPECASVRPCACCATAETSISTTSSFSSSSSSSSISAPFNSDSATCRLTKPVQIETPFRRSISVRIPFLRSRFSAGDFQNLSHDQKNIPVRAKPKTSSIFSLFRNKKSRQDDDRDNRERKESKENGNENDSKDNEDYLYRSKIEDFEMMMMRSRSVSVSVTSAGGGIDVRSSPSKGKGWHLTSPMKVFRRKSSSQVVQDRSPLHRGEFLIRRWQSIHTRTCRSCPHSHTQTMLSEPVPRWDGGKHKAPPRKISRHLPLDRCCTLHKKQASLK